MASSSFADSANWAYSSATRRGGLFCILVPEGRLDVAMGVSPWLGFPVVHPRLLLPQFLSHGLTPRATSASRVAAKSPHGCLFGISVPEGRLDVAMGVSPWIGFPVVHPRLKLPQFLSHGLTPMATSASRVAAKPPHGCLFGISVPEGRLDVAMGVSPWIRFPVVPPQLKLP